MFRSRRAKVSEEGLIQKSTKVVEMSALDVTERTTDVDHRSFETAIAIAFTAY